MKKILSLVLLVCLMVTTNINVYASEKNDDKHYYVNDTANVLDGKTESAICMEAKELYKRYGVQVCLFTDSERRDDWYIYLDKLYSKYKMEDVSDVIVLILEKNDDAILHYRISESLKNTLNSDVLKEMLLNDFARKKIESGYSDATYNFCHKLNCFLAKVLDENKKADEELLEKERFLSFVLDKINIFSEGEYGGVALYLEKVYKVTKLHPIFIIYDDSCLMSEEDIMEYYNEIKKDKTEEYFICAMNDSTKKMDIYYDNNILYTWDQKCSIVNHYNILIKNNDTDGTAMVLSEYIHNIALDNYIKKIAMEQEEQNRIEEENKIKYEDVLGYSIKGNSKIHLEKYYMTINIGVGILCIVLFVMLLAEKRKNKRNDL